VEALFLGELGLPGFLLLCLFLVGTTIAALRCRRVGSTTAWVGAAAAGALGYWLLHASYDWLWNYPAVTAPVAFLAGTAVLPRGAAAGGRAIRGAIAGLLAVALVLTIPLFLSERYRERALGEWQSDPAAAYTDLERAANLNPTDAEAMIAEGQIAIERGETARALTALHRAKGREPNYFVPWFLSAEILARRHPAAARAELARARELNPAGPQIRRLGEALEQERKGKLGQSS
jgi:tetratricopeptide (TPR) repeat protein